jgi:transketolase
MEGTMRNAQQALDRQNQRNQALIDASRYMRSEVTRDVIDFKLDLGSGKSLSAEQVHLLRALEKDAAKTAISSLASLAEIGELDHLGGGLELIPALNMTMAVSDSEAVRYTIEHAHTSIGYFSALSAWGYVDEDAVVDQFRRGLDITGHVSWLPGGTELSGGRLGVMVPVAVGLALGLRAHHGYEGLVFCHCGDAGWVSGQALNGFMGADLHGAPIVFVMNRNGIQLSNTTDKIIDKDPRQVIAAMGVEILEIPSLHDQAALFDAYAEAARLARSGNPVLIYPTGSDTTLAAFGASQNVSTELEAFASGHSVSMDTEVWVPGSLMSYRDVIPMFECVFHVNGLAGGAGHHDGHMKGRNLDDVLSTPMFAEHTEEVNGLVSARSGAGVKKTTTARPKPGSKNLEITAANLANVSLPGVGESVSARNGSQIGYEVVAAAHPDRFFTVSCDLDPSTKFDKAKACIDDLHKFEMGITEQASSLMTNGLSMSSSEPQVSVFATFAAFFEGIAREGFELWRYHRNLDGANEGLNVTMHLSHVGSCTGRDHFSGWSLDWITLAMGYLPYLHRFYAPADARSAFVAVRDLAEHYGGHIIGIPRDNLPILDKQDGSGPLWEADSVWEDVTAYRTYTGAKKAILALGAPAYLGAEAAESLKDSDPVDVYVVNGLPIGSGVLEGLIEKYSGGIATIEDGLIGNPHVGVRGFASLVQSAAAGTGTPVAHVGIVDPTIAPSEGHIATWNHFGITAEDLVDAVKSL